MLFPPKLRCSKLYKLSRPCILFILLYDKSNFLRLTSLESPSILDMLFHYRFSFINFTSLLNFSILHILLSPNLSISKSNMLS